ncbi:MAG: hypothetical protein OEV44_00165 [Spirochaetota bacterium]|nr:hypothetical protein [Spirochaetota bacterium]
MENLKALVYGKELNDYQKALAVQEFEKLQQSKKNANESLIMKVKETYIVNVNGELIKLFLVESGKYFINKLLCDGLGWSHKLEEITESKAKEYIK